MAKKLDDLTIHNAEFAFKPDFTGTVSDYNREGKKSFDLVIPTKQMFDDLKADGWNVRQWPRDPEPDVDPVYYLNVAVNYKGNRYDPVIWLINESTKRRSMLDDNTVAQLDALADSGVITQVHVIVNPYVYPPTKFKPEGGVKAYCKKMLVYFQPDDLDSMLEELDRDSAPTESTLFDVDPF